MSYFDVYGPYDVARAPKDKKKCMPKQPDLWAAAETQDTGLSSAIGCYLFCVQHGKGYTPWYVGMTTRKEGFKAEAFEPHKLGIYNECLSKKTGRPVLFLFPMLSASGSLFSKASGAQGKKTIEWLESTLMGMAFARNAELSNIKGMKHYRAVEVNGLLGPKRPGRPYKEVAAVRRAMLGKPVPSSPSSKVS